MPKHVVFLCYKYHHLAIFIVVLWLRFTPPYSLNTQRGWHTSEFNYSVRTARTLSVNHSFKHCLTHACSLPCSAIAGCLSHILFRHSSTVTYALYTSCPFLICCHAFTLFLTHTQALCPVLLTLSYRLLKTVIHFRLFSGAHLSFLTHSSTTPVLHPISTYSSSNAFTLYSSASVICQTTGPKPLPKRFLHIVQSRAYPFNWQYPPCP